MLRRVSKIAKSVIEEHEKLQQQKFAYNRFLCGPPNFQYHVGKFEVNNLDLNGFKQTTKHGVNEQ